MDGMFVQGCKRAAWHVPTAGEGQDSRARSAPTYSEADVLQQAGGLRLVMLLSLQTVHLLLQEGEERSLQRGRCKATVMVGEGAWWQTARLDSLWKLQVSDHPTRKHEKCMQRSTTVPCAAAAVHTWHVKHQETSMEYMEQAAGQQHMMSDKVAILYLLDSISLPTLLVSMRFAGNAAQ